MSDVKYLPHTRTWTATHVLIEVLPDAINQTFHAPKNAKGDIFYGCKEEKVWIGITKCYSEGDKILGLANLLPYHLKKKIYSDIPLPYVLSRTLVIEKAKRTES